MPRLHITVRGRVQGVFFRASLADVARAHQLRGWVRNRSDGGVETVAEGSAEDLAALLAFCKEGPPGASVVHVDSADELATGEFRTFAIRPDR